MINEEYNKTSPINDTGILCPPCTFIGDKVSAAFQIFTTGNISLCLCIMIIIVLCVVKLKSKRKYQFAVPPEDHIDIGHITASGQCVVNENVQL